MHKKILIVDDESSIRELLYNTFSRQGVTVITTISGKDAIEIAQDQKPDLILLDFNMPGMDGIEVLKKIREENTKTKIVMFTGMGTDELEGQARSLGATGFLRKNLDMGVIIKAVDEILTEKNSVKNKILVVDDDNAVTLVLKEFLTKKGYDVSVAFDGESALQSVKTVKPTLVLLDINLGGMDGLVVLKRIREIDQNVGVIMITSVEDQEAFDDAKRMGAYEYIVKPFALDYLETVVLARLAIASAQIE
jgi:two-component system response regulator (stage 0 sporulation protein F)